MILIVMFPVISIGIAVIGLIASAFKKPRYSGGACIDVKMPDGEEYKDKVGTPDRGNPSIAQQFDGRLTNVFKNPMEGIL